METKQCAKCKSSKEIKYFSKDKKQKSGLSCYCRGCESIRKKEASFRRAKGLPSLRETRIIHHPKTGTKDSGLSRMLKVNYGITLKDYNKMWELQEGCCAICRKHQSEFTQRLHVDHCHSTGKIRSLLCFNCNTGIGQLKEDIEILKEAIKYLEKYK